MALNQVTGGHLDGHMYDDMRIDQNRGVATILSRIDGRVVGLTASIVLNRLRRL